LHWSQWSDLNRQPPVYKTDALPLRHIGIHIDGVDGRIRTYNPLALPLSYINSLEAAVGIEPTTFSL
jgi:hypothetical protein